MVLFKNNFNILIAGKMDLSNGFYSAVKSKMPQLR
jgi:hypothetical protein